MSSRPFLVTAEEEPPLDRREDSALLPGEIRRPPGMPPTPLLDWGRGESLLWDAKKEDEEKVQTPLAGYGRGDNLWGMSPTSSGEPGELAGMLQQVQRAAKSGDSPLLGHRQQSLEELTSGMQHENSTGGASASAGMFRTASQTLSDELYFHAQWFPPPPPPRVPKEARRARSELWYYYASKWDITNTQAPPPRCPLQLMEEEFTHGMQPLSLVPYRGEYWLDRCQHWYNHVQQCFKCPGHHAPHLMDPSYALFNCVTE